MALNLGAAAVDALKVGSADVSKVMLGTEQVWPVVPAAAPWTPADLGVNTRLWIDAMATGTIDVVETDKVSEWRTLDLGGTKLVQGTSQNQPQLLTGAKPSVRCVRRSSTDGTWMRTAVLTETANVAVFLFVTPQALDPLPVNSVGNIFSYGPFPDSPDNQGIGLASWNTWGGSSLKYTAETSPPSMTSAVQKVGIDGATPVSGVSSDSLPPPVRNTGAIVFYGVTGYVPFTPLTRKFQINLLNVGPTFHCGQHDFHEIVILDVPVTDDIYNRMTGYLAHKWGHQAQLPADHPYKSAPPTKPAP